MMYGYSVPGNVLFTLYNLIHLIFTASCEVGPYFTDEETTAERLSNFLKVT